MVPCPRCTYPLDEEKVKELGVVECKVCVSKVAQCPLTETLVEVDHEIPLTEYLGG